MFSNEFIDAMRFFGQVCGIMVIITSLIRIGIRLNEHPIADYLTRAIMLDGLTIHILSIAIGNTVIASYVMQPGIYWAERTAIRTIFLYALLIVLMTALSVAFTATNRKLKRVEAELKAERQKNAETNDRQQDTETVAAD